METKKDNMLYAVLCCIGLGLAGALIFGLILYFGYISWIGAYLVVALSALGYKLFTKRKLEFKDYLIIGVVSVVLAVAAFLIGSAVGVMSVFAKSGLEISFKDSFKAIFDPASLGLGLSTEDCNAIRSAFMRDGIISFVMLALGMVSVFYYDRKQIKHQTTSADVVEIQPEQYVEPVDAEDNAEQNKEEPAKENNDKPKE